MTSKVGSRPARKLSTVAAIYDIIHSYPTLRKFNFRKLPSNETLVLDIVSCSYRVFKRAIAVF